MAECRLGFDAFHTASLDPENVPLDYVVVECICPCGEYTTKFCLHRMILYHLIGSVPRELTGPIMRRCLRLLSTLQGQAIMEACRGLEKTEEKTEESPER